MHPTAKKKKKFNSVTLLAESKMTEKILSISDLEVAGSKKLPTPARGKHLFLCSNSVRAQQF